MPCESTSTLKKKTEEWKDQPGKETPFHRGFDPVNNVESMVSYNGRGVFLLLSRKNQEPRNLRTLFLNNKENTEMHSPSMYALKCDCVLESALCRLGTFSHRTRIMSATVGRVNECMNGGSHA